MIGFVADELFDELVGLAEREGHAGVFDREAVVALLIAAIEEANRHAEGRLEDEPAAIFCALGRRAHALRPVARAFISAVVQAQAVASGFELELNDMELRVFYAGIVCRDVGFAELRGWLEASLRPMEQASKRTPPQRPR